MEAKYILVTRISTSLVTMTSTHISTYSPLKTHLNSSISSTGTVHYITSGVNVLLIAVGPGGVFYTVQTPKYIISYCIFLVKGDLRLVRTPKWTFSRFNYGLG